jgi:hypothetical protein
MASSPNDHQFQEIWDRAQAEYDELSGVRNGSQRETPPCSPNELLDKINKQHIGLDSFRAKKHRLFQTLAYALMPIELVGDLAAGGASLVCHFHVPIQTIELMNEDRSSLQASWSLAPSHMSSMRPTA